MVDMKAPSALKPIEETPLGAIEALVEEADNGGFAGCGARL